MKIDVVVGKPEHIKSDALIVGIFEKEQLSDRLKQLDRHLKGEISYLIARKEFEGKPQQIKVIPTLGILPARRLVLAGLGKRKNYTVETLRRVSSAVAKSMEAARVTSYTSLLHQAEMAKRSREECAFAFVEGLVLGTYRFDKYKKEEQEKKKRLQRVSLLEDGQKSTAALTKAIAKAELICAATNYVRDLVNTPASIRTPAYLAQEAQRIGREQKITVTVYDKKGIERMGFRALLAVSQGSAHEPRFIVMDYNPRGKESITLVGKGITFDSGGLDIKPWPHMMDMKSDMAGAGAILGVMKVISAMKIPLRVIGIIPATDNMPGPAAYRAGDIVAAYNKKTIEILNTDAEGRVILADGLSYAETLKPRAIIDLATLTGACIIALGYSAAGLLGSDQKLMDRIEKAGEETHERVWQFPLWEEYEEMVKGDNADVRNIGKGRGDAGVIAGAAFLKAFVSDTPWAHLDIAGPAWLKEPEHYTPKDATGYGVRLLVNLLENWKNK